MSVALKHIWKNVRTKNRTLLAFKDIEVLRQVARVDPGKSLALLLVPLVWASV